ncbi:MAG TPA: iron donor protein CyaY [Accumulibacter sp.]|uniref:iron donor protein CyaY n=2 Tax=Accumulibacter sp. TaxID=2053492 RepID=UPI0026112878|nr:iron donor protein CyaY [Accumulibacter sp.]MDS4053948.1 iron donor protein CyaY [Accumulibacter sp.]HMW63212.1 iron donor protein CyaY [Accumulibacter sp.]HMW80644.1 iron donor protein CyaY [Accumulibacter sp.]HMX68758.1 iron donor protein CyaY [Accumulibacter sp.]HNB67695.1 iron donor protein CyaY [Accumulibacter sp.]
MDDREFAARADAALQQIEDDLAASQPDVDFARVGDGVLEIVLDDGGKLIVNRHAAAQEIWVAARSGGFHFRWDGSAWLDTRSARELLSTVSALLAG